MLNELKLLFLMQAAIEGPPIAACPQKLYNLYKCRRSRYLPPNMSTNVSFDKVTLSVVFCTHLPAPSSKFHG